jgi:type VI secretion system protein ImpB
MDDFDPARVAEQIEPLRKLMETRNQLRDLLAKADGSEKLETLLEQILQDNEALSSLRNELGQPAQTQE